MITLGKLGKARSLSRLPRGPGDAPIQSNSESLRELRKPAEARRQIRFQEPPPTAAAPGPTSSTFKSRLRVRETYREAQRNLREPGALFKTELQDRAKQTLNFPPPLRAYAPPPTAGGGIPQTYASRRNRHAGKSLRRELEYRKDHALHQRPFCQHARPATVFRDEKSHAVPWNRGLGHRPGPPKKRGDVSLATKKAAMDAALAGRAPRETLANAAADDDEIAESRGPRGVPFGRSPNGPRRRSATKGAPNGPRRRSGTKGAPRRSATPRRPQPVVGRGRAPRRRRRSRGLEGALAGPGAPVHPGAVRQGRDAPGVGAPAREDVERRRNVAPLPRGASPDGA